MWHCIIIQQLLQVPSDRYQQGMTYLEIKRLMLVEISREGSIVEGKRG